MNVPRTTKTLSASVIQCRGNCVLDAIGHHTEMLSNQNLSSAERGEALILLAHWIADIHQPLHVAYADDRGGSDIELIAHPVYGRHLHSAWDTGILKASRGRRRLSTYIANLSVIAPELEALWQQDTAPLLWARESYRIATSPEAGYCQWNNDTLANTTRQVCRSITMRKVIGETYQNLIGPILERRLQQAAVRLAETIERALD